MLQGEKSTRGKLLYFPLRSSVYKDEHTLVRREFVPAERDPHWLTAAMLGGRARRVMVHYVEQVWVPARGGTRQKLWLAALLSHETLFPPLRLTPRLCREMAAMVGLPHPRHWVGHGVWLVPRRVRDKRWVVQVARGYVDSE